QPFHLPREHAEGRGALGLDAVPCLQPVACGRDVVPPLRQPLFELAEPVRIAVGDQSLHSVPFLWLAGKCPTNGSRSALFTARRTLEGRCRGARREPGLSDRTERRSPTPSRRRRCWSCAAPRRAGRDDTSTRSCLREGPRGLSRARRTR